MSARTARLLTLLAPLFTLAACAKNETASLGDAAADLATTPDLPVSDLVDAAAAVDIVAPDRVDVPSAIDASDVLDVLDVIDVPDVIDAPDVVDVPDVIDAPDFPDVPADAGRRALSFESIVVYPTGTDRGFSGGIAFGDVNGDGRLDIAGAASMQNQVGVMLALPGGGFGLATWYPASGPNNTRLLDVNGDGRLDLLHEPTIQIRFGRGDGTFEPTAVVAAPEGRTLAEPRDLNGDGVPDFAVGPAINGTQVTILLGSRAGTYTAGPVLSANASVGSVGLGDFDGDGRVDLLGRTSNPFPNGTFRLFPGRGDGTFGASRDMPLAAAVGRFVAVRDLDGDGREDVVTQGSQVEVYLSRADGTFAAQGTPSLGIAGGLSTLGDLDRDGRLDIVGSSTRSDFRLLRGDGRGGFAAGELFSDGRETSALAIDDASGDGLRDVIFVGAVPRVAVQRPGGAGFFAPRVMARGVSGNRVYNFAAADTNRDGVADLAVPNLATRAVVVLGGRPDGSFSVAATVALPFTARTVFSARFDDDDRPDLIVREDGGSRVVWLRATGDHAFAAPVALTVTPFAVLDLDLDGAPDAVGLAPATGYFVAYGDGRGAFGTPTTVAPFNALDAPTSSVADVDGDGRAELLLVRNATGALTVIRSDAARSWTSSSGGTIDRSLRDLVAADLDGDGRPELVEWGVTSPNFAVLRRRPDGTFAESFRAPTMVSLANSICAQDLDGDGVRDLLFAGPPGFGSAFVGRGDGTFGARIAVDTAGTQVTCVDVTGDRLPDLLTVHLADSSDVVMVRRNITR